MNHLRAVTDGLLVRFGTFLTATALGYGIHADHVNVAVPAILVIVGVTIDMITGAIIKRMGR